MWRSLVLVAFATAFAASMKMDPDGGYRNIVIKVAGDNSVPEEMCPKIISNIKVVNHMKFAKESKLTDIITFPISETA